MHNLDPEFHEQIQQGRSALFHSVRPELGNRFRDRKNGLLHS